MIKTKKCTSAHDARHTTCHTLHTAHDTLPHATPPIQNERSLPIHTVGSWKERGRGWGRYGPARLLPQRRRTPRCPPAAVARTATYTPVGGEGGRRATSQPRRKGGGGSWTGMGFRVLFDKPPGGKDLALCLPAPYTPTMGEGLWAQTSPGKKTLRFSVFAPSTSGTGGCP